MPRRLKLKAGRSFKATRRHHSGRGRGEPPLEQTCDASQSEEALLMEASASCDLRKMKELIERGVDMECTDEFGNTPLHTVVYFDWLEGLEYLLRKKANTELVNDEHETPLHTAAVEGHTRMTIELLKANADIGARDQNKNTPLHLACLHGFDELAQELISHGSDCEALNDGEDTPLHLAVRFGGPCTVRMLLGTPASVDALNDRAVSPLYVTAGQSNADCGRESLKPRANVNRLNAEKESPLYLACKAGSVESVKALLQRDASPVINLKSLEGKTALHVAAEKQEAEIARLLVDAGADVSALDEEGKTPYELVPGFCKTMEFLRPECLLSGGTSLSTSLAYPLTWPELSPTESSDQESLRPNAECNEVSRDPKDDCMPLMTRENTTRQIFGQLDGSGTGEVSRASRCWFGDEGSIPFRRPILETRSLPCKHVSDGSWKGHISLSRSKSLNSLRDLREGDRIAEEYVIEEHVGAKETERFARRLTTQERVRLKFCLDRSQYEKLKSFHEELRGAKYVSMFVTLSSRTSFTSFCFRMIEAIETVEMLPPFLVLDVGCHTLQSVIRKKEIDAPSKDHALRQTLLGLQEMHKKGIIHGNLNLHNIEFSKDELKWKLTALDFAERFGRNYRTPPFSASIAPEVIRAAEDDKVVPASPELDMWSYGMVALTLLAGESKFDKRTMLSKFRLEEMLVRKLRDNGPRCYAELLDNLLLSPPQDRESAKNALQMLDAPGIKGGNQFLEQEMKLVKCELRRLSYESSRMRGGLECANLQVSACFTRVCNDSSTRKKEEDAFPLHDDSVVDDQIFALQIGETYRLHISLTSQRYCQEGAVEITKIAAKRSDGSYQELYTAVLRKTEECCEAWAHLDLSTFQHEQLQRLSPMFAALDAKFAKLELIITFVRSGVFSSPTKLKHCVRCCVFPKESKLTIQRLAQRCKNGWSQLPQLLRDGIKLATAGFNTAMSAAGAASL